MDLLGINQIHEFLKESLVGRKFSGEFSMDIEPVTRQGRSLITIGKSEIEIKANLHAAHKLLQIYPKVRSGIIIANTPIEKITKLSVNFTSKNDVPPLGWHVWTLDKVCYQRNDLGGIFTYHVTKINPPEKISILNDFDWQVFYLSVKEFFRYATFFAVILVYAMTEFMKHLYLMIYKFLDILPRLVDSLMPLFLGIVNGLTKVVGGFYLLLVMVWSGNPPGQNLRAPRVPPRQLEYKQGLPRSQPRWYSNVPLDKNT